MLCVNINHNGFENDVYFKFSADFFEEKLNNLIKKTYIYNFKMLNFISLLRRISFIHCPRLRNACVKLVIKLRNIKNSLCCSIKYVYYMFSNSIRIITKTCPCNIQRFFSALMIENFIKKF